MRRDLANAGKARFTEKLGGLIVGTLVAGFAGAATAGSTDLDLAPSKRDAYHMSTRVSVDELREMRGGIRINGVDFDFGAIVTVLSDGTKLAETNFTFSDTGPVQRELQIFDSSRVSVFEGGKVALDGINANFPKGVEGVVVTGVDGASLALHALGPGNLSNIVVNNATGQNIQQTFHAVLTINNFPELRAGILSSQMVANLRTVMNDRSVSGF